MEKKQTVLWSRDGFIDDPFHYAETLEEAGNKPVILPLSAWLCGSEPYQNHQEKREALSQIGVMLNAEEGIEAILPYLDIIPVIALALPTFSDGRAYSKAVQLKTQTMFQGELRATGDILIDQIQHLLRVGFDTLEITHALTIERLQNGDMIKFPGFYQPGTGLQRQGATRAWRKTP